MKKRDLAYQVSLVTIIVNLILTIFKLFESISNIPVNLQESILHFPLISIKYSPFIKLQLFIITLTLSYPKMLVV